VTAAPHFLLMALISAALCVAGLKSGVMPLRGIPIRRAEYPRLFAFWAVAFGTLSVGLLAAAIYTAL
jgi:hypothetical protein